MTSGPRLSAKRKIAPRRGNAEESARAASNRPVETLPIRTRGLTKTYGDLVAVDHLDLEVHAGEIFGLLGQNGAGKTTTILMLLGLTEPTEGEARVVGLDPARNPLEVKRRVGYMPDSVGFYTDLTGRENLRYTARLNRIPGGLAETTIDEVLEQVGLTERADSLVDTYSRGMLQRLGIADALVKDPDILILDEPTTAIDPLGVVEILDLIRSLADERGLAVLLSSHLLDQAQSICDRVGIFHRGRLIGRGTVPELATRYGFGTNRLEIVVDSESAADDEKVRSVLTAIDGVVSVDRGIRGVADAGTDDPVAAGRRERGQLLALNPLAEERSRGSTDASASAAGQALGSPQSTWNVAVDPAREHEVARAIVERLVASKIGIEHFSRVTASLQQIYRVAVERSGAGIHGSVA
jgi:ABC-2 type transport system ATP-binding protein